MMKLMNIVKTIWDVEGFAISLSTRPEAIQVHAERREYGTRSMNHWAVDKWIDQRFKRVFPNYDVIVLLADGKQADQSLTLGDVRDSYL